MRSVGNYLHISAITEKARAKLNMLLWCKSRFPLSLTSSKWREHVKIVFFLDSDKEVHALRGNGPLIAISIYRLTSECLILPVSNDVIRRCISYFSLHCHIDGKIKTNLTLTSFYALFLFSTTCIGQKCFFIPPMSVASDSLKSILRID